MPIPDYGNGTTLYFYPWIPFGFLSSGTMYSCKDCPDGMDSNGAYANANNNSFNFWGWSPFFNLVQQIVATVKTTGISFEEFVFLDEVNVFDFTTEARFFYDNTRQVDVLNGARYYMGYYGFDPLTLTFSVAASNPSASGSDCASAWGDSATLYAQSAMTGAFAGGGGSFGFPVNPSAQDNLWCGGTITSANPQLQLSYPQPDVTDVHVYPCVFQINGTPSNCNSTADATQNAGMEYSDLWAFLSYRGLTGNTVIIGETQPDQNCDGFTTAMAPQNVTGYEGSSLYGNDASRVVLRVWNFPALSMCYVAPTLIAYPNGPYAQ